MIRVTADWRIWEELASSPSRRASRTNWRFGIRCSPSRRNVLSCDHTSSTTRSGQTRAISSRRDRTSPARSTSAMRISRERLPITTGALLRSRSLSAALRRNGPKDAIPMVRMSSTLATEPFSTLLKIAVSYYRDTHFATATSLPHAHFAGVQDRSMCEDPSGLTSGNRDDGHLPSAKGARRSIALSVRIFDTRMGTSLEIGCRKRRSRRRRRGLGENCFRARELARIDIR